MIINKYHLYFIVLLAAFAISMGPRFVHLYTYKQTKGIVAGYEKNEVYTKNGKRIINIPLIVFMAGEEEVTIYGPTFMNDEIGENAILIVYYNEKKPTSAFIYNFYDFWGSVLIYLGPFVLVWTACIFGVGFIPKYINLKVLEGKLFGKKSEAPEVKAEK